MPSNFAASLHRSSPSLSAQRARLFSASPPFQDRLGASGSCRHVKQKLYGSKVRVWARLLRFDPVRVSMDDGDSSVFDDWNDNGVSGYAISSSDGEDGEDSDGELVLNPVNDVELPSVKVSTDDALRVTTHRLAIMSRGHTEHRVYFGVFMNVGLIIFLTLLLLYVDLYGWKIVRLPLSPFFLIRPFFISAVLASSAGYVCVPFLRSMKIYRCTGQKGACLNTIKKRTATMGGLFFVPIGIAVAKAIAGFSSKEVSAAAAATLAYSSIGLCDDAFSLMNKQSSWSGSWFRLLLEAAVGIWFSFWMDTTSISSPYGMKMILVLPAPLGLVCLRKCYMMLTSICFVFMGNGIEVTDDFDGLAGGTAAFGFVGMSIAVLPICSGYESNPMVQFRRMGISKLVIVILPSDLAIFGASMAGACVGFLLHNRYKASVFMGNTGSLALGGALSAMAACTGMFFPLFIASGIFFIESSSIILQVLYFKITKNLYGSGRRLFKMVPFHLHLQQCGIKESLVVAGGYVIASVFSLIAAYVALTSA